MEKYVLGGLLKNPDVVAELDAFLSVGDFFNEVHQSIYSVIRNLYIAGEHVDKVIVSERIINIGITAKDEISIHEYLDAITLNAPKKNAIVKYATSLIKYRIRRDIRDTTEEIQQYVSECGNDTINEIISKSDSLYSDKVSSYELDDEPVNIFEDFFDDIEKAGENPIDENGLRTPYPEFNRLFGGLREGNIYAIVSRPAQGKTTFINDVCLNTSVLNGVPALVLDTEMSTKEIRNRMAAAQTGVPLWYLESGNWRKNKSMYEKVREYQK